MEEKVLEEGISDLQQSVARDIRKVAEKKDGLLVITSTRHIGDIDVEIKIKRRKD
jgi:hypothetical protein